MLMYAILAAIVSAVFWSLSKSKESRMIWAVVCLAIIAMICYTMIAPLE